MSSRAPIRLYRRPRRARSPATPPNDANRRAQALRRLAAVHRNDVENIPLFFAVGLLYALIEPSVFWARLLFFACVGRVTERPAPPSAHAGRDMRMCKGAAAARDR